MLFSDVLHFYKDIFIHNYFEKPFVESNKVGIIIIIVIIIIIIIFKKTVIT